MKQQIVVIGSSNTDLIVKAPRIPKPGETVLGGRFIKAAGGKGANQAVAAARAEAKGVSLRGSERMPSARRRCQASRLTASIPRGSERMPCMHQA